MPDKEFLVRPTVASDCDVIAEVHVASIRTIGASAYDQAVVDDWGGPRSGELYRVAMNEGELYFVAVERETGKGERILGFSCYREEAGRHRTAVYVRGDSVREGVGAALYCCAESAALVHGAREIDVDSSICAVAFYKSNGFRELRTGEPELKSSKRMACVFMRKQFQNRRPNTLVCGVQRLRPC
jgi:GNAT superfamily N-acetyltransferase